MPRLRPLTLGIVCALGLLAGCSAEDATYVGGPGYFAFAMTADTPPLAVMAQTAVFAVEQPVELPVRRPTAAQMNALSPVPAEISVPWDRLPWMKRHDYELQIDYVISNLEDTEQRVVVTVNGRNEFDEYFPGVIIQDNEAVAEFAGWERTWILAPGERKTGIIREEEMDEVAVDLATVVNGVTNADAIVHPRSQSSTDPRALPFIPDVVPALVGFRVGLRVVAEADRNVAPTPPAIACEFTVRARDRHHRNPRIVPVREAWQLPDATPFYPADLLMMMP